ncbi:YeeE/YedE thiosulfate transporter family protein [Rapidithrix thailandica]|uniref:YeeE/YedE thiosulfate transporter family protein n=1 Tax=Rapidithrix thailandica TaxID=413964 RepID=A0AAW9S8T6_9BACT
MELIYQPWPWYVAGPAITLVMFLLLYFNKTFGISSNLRTMCSISGAGKFSDFFRFDWRSQIWNLIFVLGTVIGGFIASHYLTPDQSVQLSPAVVTELQALGIAQPGAAYLPLELFNWENLFSVKGFIMMVVGGFLVGFGTRYAGGCTSGHAISGLSDLQLPSLIAVIGFFIGGLAVTYLVLPYLL